MNKKYTILILVVIILLLIISSYTYMNSSNKNIEEYNYNYKEVKEEVLNKIKIMSADDLLINLYDKDINVNNIDNELLLKGILLSLDIDGERKDEEIDVICEKNNICINNDYINKSSVDRYVKDIYGDIKYDYELKDLYYYDKDSNKYYEYCTNSLESDIFIESYISDVNLVDNKIDVDIYIAYGREEEVLSNKEYVTNISIYKDKNLKDKYYQYTYSSKKPQTFEIDENNYKEFTKYTYTFIDNGEGFKFKELKKE